MGCDWKRKLNWQYSTITNMTDWSRDELKMHHDEWESQTVIFFIILLFWLHIVFIYAVYHEMVCFNFQPNTLSICPSIFFFILSKICCDSSVVTMLTFRWTSKPYNNLERRTNSWKRWNFQRMVSPEGWLTVDGREIHHSQMIEKNHSV